MQHRWGYCTRAFDKVSMRDKGHVQNEKAACEWRAGFSLACTGITELQHNSKQGWKNRIPTSELFQHCRIPYHSSAHLPQGKSHYHPAQSDLMRASLSLAALRSLPCARSYDGLLDSGESYMYDLHVTTKIHNTVVESVDSWI